MQSAELGFGLRSIGRGLKKAGKGVVKAHAVAGKTALKAGVLYAKLQLLPLRFLVKAVVKLGRVICKAPTLLLESSARLANVDPSFIPLFCTAVRENKIEIGSLKRLLPPALKIASKMAASGAFPPIVPALAVIKYVPFVNRFMGVDDLGSYTSDLRNPAIRPAVDTMEMLALSDHLGLLGDSDVAALGLSDDDRAAMQGYLAAAANEPSRSVAPLTIAAVGLAGLGVGYLIARRK